LARFLEEGHFESHVNRMKVFYRGQRDAVLTALRASPLADRVHVLGEQAGLHFLLQLDTDKTDAELAERAEAFDIRLSFLSDYQRRPGVAPPHILVINYPGLELARLAQALDLLAQWI
jgi:GntR family transcriptional regulator/MocR family aminotransferase